MNQKFLKRNKPRRNTSFIEPDEIFLDSKNLENFDNQQFEGRIEKQISKKTIVWVGGFFIIFALIFCSRLGFLQIKKGEAYLKRSQNNTLERQTIFADRGIIYDRNKKELAWNIKNEEVLFEDNVEKISFSTRTYKSPGFSHLLGYVNYPLQDKKGNYWQTEFIGKDGLEKMYNIEIRGENGEKIVETDVNNKKYSENVVNAPKNGTAITTTIDSRIQSKLFTLIKNLSENNSFSGGAGILMDIRNGEILTLTSFPEYNGEILSLGKDSVSIKNYLNDKRKVFLDRTISGLYTPGSIVKPFFALGALNEGIINANKKILSTGSISIPNPYFPDQKTVFKDWRAHGWTDMVQALAVSSDVYFYTIGGGFEGQKGLGIINLEKYAKFFSIGEKTGVDLPDEKEGTIPNPEWKIKNFEGDPWRIGNTYHTAIGQYGFQVTPLQMTRAVSAIANYGKLISPHLILEDLKKEEQTTLIDLKKEDFDIIHQGMKQAVDYGTAVALNVPYIKVAAKTGTAQIGVAKNKINSWIIGFFPYENPKYAFTILMEAGPSTNSTGASYVMRQLLDWMNLNTPEYFK
jgi:penicillin-binding protein 2